MGEPKRATQWVKIEDVQKIVKETHFDINVTAPADPAEAAQAIAQAVFDEVTGSILKRLGEVEDVIELHFDVVKGEVVDFPENELAGVEAET